MSFLNKRSGEASFLLLSAVCGITGSACASAVEEDGKVSENNAADKNSDDNKTSEEDVFDFEDEYDYDERVESAWSTLMKILLVGVPAAGTAGAVGGGVYLHLKPEERKRIVDSLLDGRYVDAAKADKLVKKLEEKIDALEKVIKEKEAQNEKEKKAIEEALKRKEGDKPGETSTKIEDVSPAMKSMISKVKAQEEELKKLKKITEELEKNPGNRKLEEDYRSKIFGFCNNIKNDSARNFFKYYFLLSAGNSTFFNFVHLLTFVFVILSNFKVVFYGNNWRALMYNPLGKGTWQSEVIEKKWRFTNGILGLADSVLSFCVPYWSFFSAAVKGVTSGVVAGKRVYDYLTTGEIDANRLTGTINADRFADNSIGTRKIQGLDDHVKDVVKSGLRANSENNGQIIDNLPSH